MVITAHRSEIANLSSNAISLTYSFIVVRSTRCRHLALTFATITNGMVCGFEKSKPKSCPLMRPIALPGHTAYNKSLDASGGPAVLDFLAAAEGALHAATPPTPPVGRPSLGIAGTKNSPTHITTKEPECRA